MSSEVVYSLLCQSFEHEGSEYKIEIYEADRPSAWLLEVLHENGASTVWDDVFEDDKAALDEAILAIQEGLDDELIDFTPVEWGFIETQLKLGAHEALAALAGTEYEVLGVLAAVATAPQLVPPGDWLGLLLREDSDDEALKETISVLMDVYNAAIRCLDEGSLPVRSFETFMEVGEWAAGYLEIAMADETWANDDEALEEMSVLASLGELPSLEPEVADDIVQKLAMTMTPRETAEMAMRLAARMHDYWAPERHAGAVSMGAATFRRTETKVGRNQPCPCGSGKKHKRCCGCN